MLRLLLVLLFTAALPALALPTNPTQTPYYLWWEAEQTSNTDFPLSGEFDPQTPEEAALLSNGQWLNVGGEYKKHFAHYEITLEKTATFQFYTRKFWLHGDFRYRFNNNEWTEVRRDKHPILLDSMSFRPFIGANWVYLGEQFLEAGENRFELELLTPSTAVGFDSFVLSETAFMPYGLKRPGERETLKENDAWSFDPAIDSFSQDSLWDLRELNEPIAGINGYIKRDKTNNNFLLGNGTPVRFWAMNTFIQHSPNMTVIDYHGRHLAKRGFNMVRFHGHIESKSHDLMVADQSQIEQSWRLVAAMKNHGIYTTLSPYWGIEAKAHPEWENLNGNDRDTLAGLLFFEPTLQKAYKTWLKQWLTTNNPYTNIPLAQDPSVAIIQIQNEDSLLFWTFNSIKGKNLAQLEKRYSQWLLQRYKTVGAIEKRWGKLTESRDTQAPNFTLLPIYELTQARKGKRKQRLDDQYAFLIGLMQSWNQEVENHLREEIGYKGLINAGNWRTANNDTMLDGERLSYTSNQVIGVNRYYDGGKHINPNNRYRAGYQLEVGDLFEGKSIVFHPDKLPVNIKQVDGYPTIVSESTWSNPNPYQAEAPFLIAAYSRLNSIDGFYWFAAKDNLGFSYHFQKFPAASPTLMAGYPAAALLYRGDFIQEAKASMREYRTIDSIIAREKPLISEEVGFDPNRDTLFSHLSKAPSDIESKTLFLKGPVFSHYGKTGDNKNAIEYQNKNSEENNIRSNTGELNWDYQKGLVTIDSPKAQGATGFLKQRSTIELSTLTLNSQTDYGSILLLPLDNKTIKDSQKLLLQITTQSRPKGYRTSATEFTDPYNTKDKNRYNGYVIESLGEMPFMVKNHQMTISLKSNNIKSITVTDSNGYPIKRIPFTQSSDGILFTPPEDSIYLILSGQ